MDFNRTESEFFSDVLGAGFFDQSQDDDCRKEDLVTAVAADRDAPVRELGERRMRRWDKAFRRSNRLLVAFHRAERLRSQIGAASFFVDEVGAAR
ncbi:hypothetical protein [Chelativorans sp. Marseille-P2723]|uniref:hypothetical protein n=1 Tax=Chelativorans sp. Marseille-P2723 TaxID=2709133 RepID=UPI001AEDCF23|nr:hypothetical protein [Chelativorans sp. Marseille-P2723]